MPVTPADVREVLSPDIRISDELLREFVAAGQSEVAARVGVSLPAEFQGGADSAVRLRAAAAVLRAVWSGSSIEEPGNARAMDQRAEVLITSLAALTSVPGEEVFLGEGLVSAPDGAPLWSYEEFRG